MANRAASLEPLAAALILSGALAGCSESPTPAAAGQRTSFVPSEEAGPIGQASPGSSAHATELSPPGASPSESASPGAEPSESSPAPTYVYGPPSEQTTAIYAWLEGSDELVAPLSAVAAPPKGYRRVDLEPKSFGAFLRELPMRRPEAEVHAYDGRVLRGPDHRGVFGVSSLDVSNRDLQQCADSAIRLHAEWLWSEGRALDAGYYFLSGDFATFERYARGERPKVDGPKVVWTQSAAPRSDRKAYRDYLELVFNYASTISLDLRNEKLAWNELAPGDFIVLPGSPGHAILVLDVAQNASGERVAMLGQGFMPAQDFHVLASDGSPWFDLEVEAIQTPFWPAPFPRSSLRRFRAPGG